MDQYGSIAKLLSVHLNDDIDFILRQVRPARICDLALGGRTPGTIRVLDETQQHSGSFKYRGAVTGANRHPLGVIACGSGNFPIAVGLAAAKLGVEATLVMPEDAPEWRTGLGCRQRKQSLRRTRSVLGNRLWW